jgi:hypothetical protein
MTDSPKTAEAHNLAAGRGHHSFKNDAIVPSLSNLPPEEMTAHACGHDPFANQRAYTSAGSTPSEPQWRFCKRNWKCGRRG